MRSRFLCLAAAAMLSLVVAVRAPAADTLPEKLFLHVSISSFEELIANADETVAAITDNTTNAIPPGFVDMIVQMQLPFPIEAWSVDKPMHLLLAKEDMDNPVVVFSVESFDEFRQAFEDIGTDIEDMDVDGRFVNACILQIRGMRFPMYFVQLTDTVMAASENDETITAMLDGGIDLTALTHPDDTDIMVHVDVADALARENITADIRRDLAREGETMVAKLKKVGVTDQVAERVPDLLSALVAIYDKELNTAKSLSFHLSMNAEHIILRSGVDAAEGSFLYRLGRHLAGKDTASAPLADKMSDDSLVLAVYAPITKAVPASVEEMADFSTNLLSILFPDKKDDIRRRMVASWAQFDAPMTITNVQRPGSTSNAYYIESNDPAAAVRAIVDMYACLGDLAKESFADLDKSFRLVIQEGEIGGQPFTRINGDITDPETAEKFAEAFRDFPGADFENVSLSDLFRIYIAPAKKTVVVLAGTNLTDNDLAARVAMLDNPGTPFLKAQGARDVLDIMRNNQAAYFLVNGGKLPGFIAQYIRDMSKNLPNRELVLRTLDKVEDEFETTDAFYGWGTGSDNGRFTMDLIIPTDGVNNIIRNYEIFKNAMLVEAAAAQSEVEVEVEIGDGDEDEEEE